jgi:hypothetical protein
MPQKLVGTNSEVKKDPRKKRYNIKIILNIRILIESFPYLEIL